MTCQPSNTNPIRSQREGISLDPLDRAWRPDPEPNDRRAKSGAAIRDTEREKPKTELFGIWYTIYQAGTIVCVVADVVNTQPRTGQEATGVWQSRVSRGQIDKTPGHIAEASDLLACSRRGCPRSVCRLAHAGGWVRDNPSRRSADGGQSHTLPRRADTGCA